MVNIIKNRNKLQNIKIIARHYTNESEFYINYINTENKIVKSYIDFIFKDNNNHITLVEVKNLEMDYKPSKSKSLIEGYKKASKNEHYSDYTFILVYVSTISNNVIVNTIKNGINKIIEIQIESIYEILNKNGEI